MALYNLKLTLLIENVVLERAGRWFLNSGIQTAGGGVARYYRSDLESNLDVSTEITGYSASAFAYLHSVTGDATYRDIALLTGRFLVCDAWNEQVHTFPFEPDSDRAYFFDLGIIARGLIAAGRATGEKALCEKARDAALSLAFDFLGDGVFHPVISLPEKQPLAYEKRWSRSPGCYQLKSALAWLEIGDEHASRMFDVALKSALATHESFLADGMDREMLMDRLHAYCYFLEALLFVPVREENVAALRWGIVRTAHLLREIATDFERSDVCAQLLRVRLVAHYLKIVPLDESAAADEAERAAKYQAQSSDARLDGGFWFGSKKGELLPFMNPVSTAFAMQALQLWRDHNAGEWNFNIHQLI